MSPSTGGIKTGDPDRARRPRPFPYPPMPCTTDVDGPRARGRVPPSRAPRPRRLGSAWRARCRRIPALDRRPGPAAWACAAASLQLAMPRRKLAPHAGQCHIAGCVSVRTCTCTMMQVTGRTRVLWLCVNQAKEIAHCAHVPFFMIKFFRKRASGFHCT